MTVAIPEARTRAARRSRPAVAPSGRPGPRGSEGPRSPSGQPGPGPRRAAPERPARQRREGTSRRRAAAGRLLGASTKPGSTLHNYQAIIAAEYVAATLLVAVSPIASRQAQQNASGSLSPYLPQDIIKIFAIGIVYLILEGLAAGPRGLARFSAWFGFLILLGVGLSEAAHIADIFRVLSGGGYNPVKLTGAQAPAQKGDLIIPPLVPGGQPPPGTSTSGGPPSA